MYRRPTHQLDIFPADIHAPGDNLFKLIIRNGGRKRFIELHDATDMAQIVANGIFDEKTGVVAVGHGATMYLKRDSKTVMPVTFTKYGPRAFWNRAWTELVKVPDTANKGVASLMCDAGLSLPGRQLTIIQALGRGPSFRVTACTEHNAGNTGDSAC